MDPASLPTPAMGKMEGRENSLTLIWEQVKLVDIVSPSASGGSTV